MTSRYPGGLIRKNAANTAVTGASGVWDLSSQAQAVKNNTWPISGLALPVSGSLRFRSSASAYLNRTLSASNRKTFTFNAWVKKAVVGSSTGAVLFCSTDNSTSTGWLHFNSGNYGSADTLTFEDQSSSTVLVTTQVFRDPSSWYMITLSIDTTQATSSNRAKLYVNGTQVTAFSTATYPSQNADTNFNRTSSFIHTIGSQFTNNRFFDGYLAEINFIDGQALTPASFGQTSAITGVWEPIKYTGTYGTNGYYLSLSDTSSIGKDFSGNGNNWTPNNISTTSGATFDLMRDVPTQWAPQGVTDVGGTVRGNYATFNSIRNTASTQGTITNGNLQVAGSAGAINCSAGGTIQISGKIYCEFTMTTVGFTSYHGVGILPTSSNYTDTAGLSSVGIYYLANGNKRVTGTSSAYGSSYTNGDVIGVAVDTSAETITFYKNNVSQGSISGTGVISAGVIFYVGADDTNSPIVVANFGQRPFAYTPPSGFSSLCTTNLPTPTIGATTTTAANKYFDATTYTGTGATLSVTNAGGFQPDFVWLKSRSAATNHQLFDAVRGATKVIVSNSTEAESTSANTITSFNSGGFTVGTNTAINTSTATYVGWQWNAGGSTVTNNSGSISSQVRASTTAGFSVVTYTGNGTSGATVGHGLGAAPSMLMFKNRDETGGNSILVWHSTFTNQEQMLLSSTAAIYNPGNGLYFNSTTPGASVVTLGTSGATNASAQNMLMYAWTPIAGYSAFGKYTGNGSTDGPFVFCGFRPKWIMIKRSSGIEDWRVFDTARSTYNIQGATLYPNTNGAENSGQLIDINSNGFKCRTTDVAVNGSGSTYIYAAFAETPFKYALAR